MLESEMRHLRVLIANEKRERLELLAQVVAGLGHEVIAREIYVKEVGAVTARERPDVALVGLGLNSEHALELISEKSIVKLDDERKAAMVSNLLVVLCSDRDAQPIVNTGTIYQ